jgi:eukaryotic-like serine/threonine-protein kinase
MGEVYRARDTKLDRDVAIKVLPEAFAGDAERTGRFQREAKTLASLNHPNIAIIHGLEQAGDIQALVMELVEGETLADRIGRGSIPIDEALAIAKQIAEALEAAHEQRIIHRDLKPANIKVTPDGTVKVLDFGLAKLTEASAGTGSTPAQSLSPTVTSPAMVTGVGIILGTAAYMAPEQAKGRDADKRSDIWAFGCVLYEMLTGTRPFDGEDIGDTLANVLKIDPDWSALPTQTPPPIRTLLQGCLRKDRRRRVTDISTALFVLDNSASLAPPLVDPAISQAHTDAAMSRLQLALTASTRRRVALVGAAAAIASAIVIGALWFAMRAPPPMPTRVSRLALAPSDGAALTISGIDRDLAITPDGSSIVYVGNRGTQVLVRRLDTLAPAAVFTGDPRGPFVSPDGKWIGFTDGTIPLKKVAVTGGPAATLATLDGVLLGATWGPDDTIIFATSNTATGLQRVSAAGGPTTVLTKPDRARGEADFLWPELLPGGRRVLFTIAALTGGLDAAQVAVLDLQTGTRTVLVRGGSHAHYVPTGHLLYQSGGTLQAIAFDLAQLETRGQPVPVLPVVMTTAAGGIDAVVADDGTLAYVSGGSATGAAAPRALVWVDRQGRETPIAAPSHAYVYPRLSPDGTRIVVSAADQENDLWVWDLGRATLTRATFDPGIDIHPTWTADGRHVIFSSERSGARNLYRQAADGTGAVDRLTESPNPQNAGSVSPDGRRLIFTERSPETGGDVMQVELDGAHRVAPLVQSQFDERNGIVSPDGRWLAYDANDSGQFEVYVRPFPIVTSGHWQVSTAGGTRPLWTGNGRELVYVSPTGALMDVGVGRTPSWTTTAPTVVVKQGYFTNSGSFISRTFDVSPDGQRFLMIKDTTGTGSTSAPAGLIVVQHWTEELKRLVPTK